jgi:hypothetical protein
MEGVADGEHFVELKPLDKDGERELEVKKFITAEIFVQVVTLCLAAYFELH